MTHLNASHTVDGGEHAESARHSGAKQSPVAVSHLDALVGQSAALTHGAKHCPVVLSQFGNAALVQSTLPAHAGPHSPTSAAAGSSSQFGADASVHPAWLVQGPTQIPPAPQLGRLASGQFEFDVHCAAHRPVAGSQLGAAGSMQSALIVHAPKHVPADVQFGRPAGHAVAGHLPWQSPVAPSQLGVSGSVQSVLLAHTPKQTPSLPQLGRAAGHAAVGHLA